MRSPSLLRAVGALVAASLVCVASHAAARADDDAAGVLYRIVLTDGATLVSYGEYARVADRVVFSLARLFG